MGNPASMPDFGGLYSPVRVIADNPRTVTYNAVEPGSGARRFLKLARESTCANPDLLRAFHDEVGILRLLARRAGPGAVVPVVDEGRWQGRPYFVQPLLEGWCLASAMQQRPVFLGASAMQVMERCLLLLHAIHGAGIVHGDISPENIMIVTGEPRRLDGKLPGDFGVQIVDFDVARRTEGRENRPGAPIVGKLPYMAPELFEGRPMSPATDLYALGAVFYEMLAGALPHPFWTVQELERVDYRRIAPIALTLEVPEPVEDLARQMLARDPAERIASAAGALRLLGMFDDIYRWMSRSDPPPPLHEGARRIEPKRTNVPALHTPVPPRGPHEKGDRPAALTTAHRFTSTDRPFTAPLPYAPPPPPRPSAPEPVDRSTGPPESGDSPWETIYPGTLHVPAEVVATPPHAEERSDATRRPITPGAPWDPILSLSVAEARPSGPSPPATPKLDEDVQFTVYRPRVIRPEVWHPLLVFAHHSERPPDAPADEPDPIEEVRRQARQILSERIDEYKDVVQDSLCAIPRAGELTILPEVPGIEFNPPRRVFRWEESVHREEFRMRAPDSLHGRTARGQISVFWGALLLADIALVVRVDRDHRPDPRIDRHALDKARPYRKIFVSYSHNDLEIVRQVEQYISLLGDRYLRDWSHLRAGERWDERLLQLIDEADVFQLFWSRNSMLSAFVRREWEYALSLGRDHFVRPSYWEDPFPRSDDPDLPPSGLKELHFQRLEIAADAVPPAPEAPPPGSPPSGPGHGPRPTPPPPPGPGPGSGPDSNPAGPSGRERIGPYEVVETLGRGGWGRLLRGRHRVTGQAVVIKMVGEGGGGRPILAELPSVAALRHPQVVRVIDASVEGEWPYLVRDYIEGRSLQDWRRGRNLSASEVAAMVLALTDPLREAHARGLIHHDLKPSNILVDPGGMPLLLADHLVIGRDEEGVRPGDGYGTPAYMAPERFATPSVHDPRSDVYAVGVILYELLTDGRLPFERDGGGVTRLIALIFAGGPPAPSSRAPDRDIPEALDDVCLTCLQKEPDRRYADLGALADALREFLSGRIARANEPQGALPRPES